MFLTVTLEDGKFSKVFVKKHDTFKNVLLKSCEDFGLNPDMYYLSQGKETVDLNKKVMADYYYNNDFFELRKGYRNYAFQNVTVTLEFYDLKMQGIFKLEDSLLAVIKKLYTVSPQDGEVQVIHYASATISGEELGTVTLRDLNALPGDKISLKYGPRDLIEEGSDSSFFLNGSFESSSRP